MADRVFSAAALAQLTSVDFNEIQDRLAAMRAAQSNNDIAAAAGKGLDARVWQPAALGLANATAVVLDATLDWTDRVLLTAYQTVGASANYPGGASDADNFRTAFLGGWQVALGYTGSGTLSNLATGAAVSNGNAPVQGVGAGGRSYVVEPDVGAAGVRLYVDKTTKALGLYNATGATLYPFVVVLATGRIGKR